MRTLRKLAAIASLIPLPMFAQSPAWRTVDISRQLRDTQPQRVRVQYGAGRVDVRGTSDPFLYAMHLRYDENRSVPLHRYDADQRTAALGLESRGGGLRTAFIDAFRRRGIYPEGVPSLGESGFASP